jgi:hypothetical protein
VDSTPSDEYFLGTAETNFLASGNIIVVHLFVMLFVLMFYVQLQVKYQNISWI